MFDSGFFFVLTDLVFIFTDALVGDIVVVAQRFRFIICARFADAVVGGCTGGCTHSIVRTGNANTGIII